MENLKTIGGKIIIEKRLFFNKKWLLFLKMVVFH